MLFGSFFDLTKRHTAFAVIHFPMSASHSPNFPVISFNHPLITWLAHSIAHSVSYKFTMFWRLCTISRATTSPYTFLSAQYVRFKSLNSHGMFEIERSNFSLMSQTSVCNPLLNASLAVLVVLRSMSLMNWFIHSASCTLMVELLSMSSANRARRDHSDGSSSCMAGSCASLRIFPEVSERFMLNSCP